MVIRGAPAIGVAAAMGVALGVRDSKAKNLEGLRKRLRADHQSARLHPSTAVNLFWAIEPMKRLFKELADDDADQARARSATSSSGKRSRFRPKTSKQQAHGPLRPTPAARFGNRADSLQCGRSRDGGLWKPPSVSFVQRLRAASTSAWSPTKPPFLQGRAADGPGNSGRTTSTSGLLPTTLAGTFMHQGLIDAVIVGADRIAANG